MDMNGMPAKSCRAMEVEVIKSTMKHLMAAMGCFERVKHGKRNIIGHCSGALLYQNLHGRQHDDRMLWERGL